MKAGGRNLRVIDGNVEQEIGQPRARHLKFIAAVVGLAVLLAGGVRWSQPDSELAQKIAAPGTTEPQAGAVTTDYFPAQYVNQATEIEEHIQAF